MTDLRKAAQAALDAMAGHPDNSRRSFRAAIEALSAALAQPEPDVDALKAEADNKRDTIIKLLIEVQSFGDALLKAEDERDMLKALLRDAAQPEQPEQPPWTCACGANLYIDADGYPRSKAAQPQQEPTVAVPRELLRDVVECIELWRCGDSWMPSHIRTLDAVDALLKDHK
jgi:hypothetical protein